MTKLFVIVDQSLSKRQQFVQGAHAVAQHLVDFPESPWKNETLVMLKANPGRLDHLMANLDENCHKYSVFKEPYYDNKLTAISALNMGDMVSELKLI